MRCMIVASISATCFLTLSCQALSAEDPPPGDKLPEPAIQLAKETALRLNEAEKEWFKLSERLTSYEAGFVVVNRSNSDGLLRDEANRLLTAARALLTDQKRMANDLQLLKDLLNKVALQYDEVAALYRAQAAAVRSEAVREDYQQLAKAFERKASTVVSRARRMAIPTSTETKAAVIEEGNTFVERMVEGFTVGPLGDEERGAFAERLKKHGERCRNLAEELRQEAEKILEGSDISKVKQPNDGLPKIKNPGRREPAVRVAPNEIGPLDGTWSSPVTVGGVQCITVLYFDHTGACSQTTYTLGPKGKGAQIASGTGNFSLDSNGVLSFYQRGMLVENGVITSLAKDQWSYEIVGTASPALSGKRLTFSREP